MFQSNSLIIV